VDDMIKEMASFVPFIPDPMNVKRILLVTTFRSGSTFLGDLLQHSNRLTYYHYEPLHYLILNKRIDDNQLPEARKIIQNLFQCNFKPLSRFMNYMRDGKHYFMISKNKFLSDMCKITANMPVYCSNMRLLHESCRRSQVQIMKVVRLHLKDVLTLELPVGTKIVYLQREPRAIYNSRKPHKWCRKDVCLNISAFCDERRNDLLTLKQLQNHQVTLVRFEDLALNPINETQRLFRQLGLNYTETVISFF
jgi:carbohydrate 6-sulfotransferase 6